MTDMLSQHALRAAVAVGSGRGFPSAEPVVLRDLANLLVYLAPHPVIARVATTTALLRNPVDGHLTRDLQVTRFLAQRGAPVIRPLPEPDGGPHAVDGHRVTLWEYVPGETGESLGAERFGAALRELHHQLAAYPVGGAEPATPFDDLRGFLAAPERWWPEAPAELDSLRARFEAVTIRIAAYSLDEQQLHGDAHAGNVLTAGNGFVWTDFEDTWRGPRAWDLACVAESGRLDPAPVLAAYGDLPAREVMADFRLLRRLHQTAWLVVLASRFPALHDDAAQRIAAWAE